MTMTVSFIKPTNNLNKLNYTWLETRNLKLSIVDDYRQLMEIHHSAINLKHFS